jgi:hypothetical protein
MTTGVAQAGNALLRASSVFDNIETLLTSICYGSDKFVCVGESDGSTFVGLTKLSGDHGWTAVSIPAGGWNSVCYTGSRFVAVGLGHPHAMYSDDGYNWVAQPDLFAYMDLRSVAFGAGRVVGVGVGGISMVSTNNGTSWTVRTAAQNGLPTSGRQNFIAFGNGVFVVGCQDGKIYTSADGLTWTQRTSGTINALRCGVFGGGTWVILGMNNTLVRSTNNTTWTHTLLSTTVSLSMPTSVAHSGTRFVATRDPSVTLSNSDNFAYSNDGLTWVKPATGLSQPSRGIAYGGGQFTLATRPAVVSTDGITFAGRFVLTDQVYRASCRAFGKYYLFGVGPGDKTAGSSLDGVTWEALTTPHDPTVRVDVTANWPVWTAAAASDSRIVVVRGYVEVGMMHSGDGVSWSLTGHNLPSGNDYRGVAHGGGKFVVVGAAYYNFATMTGYQNLFTSSDGLSWTPIAGGHNVINFNAIAYAHGRFIAVGQWHSIYTSVDGVTWQASALLDNNNWCCIASSSVRTVVASPIDHTAPKRFSVLVTTDGVNWTEHVVDVSSFNFPSQVAETRLAHVGGRFVLCGTRFERLSPAPPVLESYDGVTWTLSTAVGVRSPTTLLGHGRTLISGGPSGVDIARSY